MRMLSEIQGEEALDVLADLIDPVSEISTDEEFVNLVRAHKNLEAARKALHDHKKSILRILAVVNGVDEAEYNPSFWEIPMSILKILNDPAFKMVFQLADPKKPSGSATENTAETAGE